MRPDVVVDIGNSRMKWGRCVDGRVIDMASLPLAAEQEWARQLEEWRLLTGPANWAIASVNPPASEQFEVWLKNQHHVVLRIAGYQSLPIQVQVREPASVGIDRLLNALAAHRLASPHPAIVLSVGTAVTVDVVDGAGVFAGGAIFPGPHLMALALHEHTAKLPLVEAEALLAEERSQFTSYPCGQTTTESILIGIEQAIVGGALSMASLLGDRFPEFPRLFVTGGGLAVLAGRQLRGVEIVAMPNLTLEGVRLAAETC